MNAFVLATALVGVLFTGYHGYENFKARQARCEMYDYYLENTTDVYRKVEFADNMIAKYGEEEFLLIAAEALSYPNLAKECS